jgi:hypothetical protein
LVTSCLVVSRVGIEVVLHAVAVADTGARSGWKSDAGMCYDVCAIVRLVVLHGYVSALRRGKREEKGQA